MAAWTFIALGTFTKGIHALLIPVTAIILHRMDEALDASRYGANFFFGRTVGFCSWRFSCPGIWLMESRYPGFLRDHFFNEQIGSALSRRWPPDSDRVPLWIFWPEHLVLLFPISLLFPAAFRAALQRWKDRRPWISDDGFLTFGMVSRWRAGDQFCQCTGLLSDDRVGAHCGLDRLGRHQKREFRSNGLRSLLSLCWELQDLWLHCFWRFRKARESGDSSGSNSLIGDTILNVFQVLPSTVWKEIIPLFCIGHLRAGGWDFGLSFDRKGRSELCLAGFALLMAAIFVIGTRGMQLVEDGVILCQGCGVDRLQEPFRKHRHCAGRSQ